MSHVLVKYVGDYADEFSVYGFCVLSRSQWAKVVETLRQIPNEYFEEVYFGTNEFMSWENSEDFLRDTYVEELSDAEVAVFKKYFSHHDGTVEFGNTFIDQVMEQYEEEKGEDNDN
jgi:hypothetical protein